MTTRTITVKGIGKASAKPDLVVVELLMESRSMDYGDTMNLAAQNINHLNATLAEAGFEKESVKTTRFDVKTDYDDVKDQYGNHSQKFNGYVIRHKLKIEFDFDMQRLARVLAYISDCIAHPKLSVQFTVKDFSALNREMLRNATIAAKEKAEILCEASGVTLGNLLSIDYNWSDIEIRSNMEYESVYLDLSAEMAKASIDIDPDDVDVRDTATFVWEIR